MLCLVDPTEENTRIAGEKIMVLDYPDGTLAFKYGQGLRAKAARKFSPVSYREHGLPESENLLK